MAAILTFFPVFWIADSLLTFGSLDNLSVARIQGAAGGVTILHALKVNHLLRLVLDAASTPLLVGLLALAHLSWQDGRLRLWVGLLFAPLFVITGIVVVTKSVAIGAPWRISGPWALLLLPFLAYWLKGFAWSFDERHRRQVLVAAVLLCALGFVYQSLDLYLAYRNDSRFTEGELAAGRAAGAITSRGSQKILIESETHRYLNVLVASNRPERFVLSTGSDPIRVALYAHRSQYWKEHDSTIYRTYVEPKYDFSNGLRAETLAKNNIGYVMLHAEAHKIRADANPELAVVGDFGEWKLYEVVPPRPAG